MFSVLQNSTKSLLEGFKIIFNLLNPSLIFFKTLQKVPSCHADCNSIVKNWGAASSFPGNNPLKQSVGPGITCFIIWLAPRAGKMSQILRFDWLPERSRWSYLARSGLPVARPLGIESLIPRNNAIFSSIFSLFWRKMLTKMSGKPCQHLPKGKERE